MSATSSVDGLISSLKTADVIDQLMQLEQQPQLRLQQKVSAENKVIAAYQDLNTKFAAVQTAADDAASSSTWQSMKATSSDTDAVAVSASSGALAASLSF